MRTLLIAFVLGACFTSVAQAYPNTIIWPNGIPGATMVIKAIGGAGPSFQNTCETFSSTTISYTVAVVDGCEPTLQYFQSGIYAPAGSFQLDDHFGASYCGQDPVFGFDILDVFPCP